MFLFEPVKGSCVPRSVKHASAAFFTLVATAFPAIAAAQWPQSLAGVTAMYECYPASPRITKNSIIVWVDKSQQVVALSAAREGWKLPTYALAAVMQEDASAVRSTKKAAVGYRVFAASTPATFNLHLGEVLTSCMPTWDD